MPRLALAAWYATFTGSIALSPWLVVLLTDAGWSEAHASALLAVLPAGRLLGMPLWAALADRTGPAPVLWSTMAAAVLASVALGVARAPWLVFFAMLVWALARAPAAPIVDATTVSLVGRRYGQIRSVGSVAFLVVAGLSGAMRDRWLPLPIVVSTVLATAALGLLPFLPGLVRAGPPPSLSAFAGLARHPVLVPLLIVAILHGAVMSTYDQLFALHVQQLGLGSSVTGAALAVGVGVEIALLATGERWLARIGPRRLLLLGVGVGVPRFLLTAVLTHPVALVATQALHGVHFGAFWLAATALFAEQAPAGLRNTTQALLPAAAFGAGPLLGLTLGAAVLALADPPSTSALYATMAGLALLASTGLALSYRGSPPHPRG